MHTVQQVSILRVPLNDASKAYVDVDVAILFKLDGNFLGTSVHTVSASSRFTAKTRARALLLLLLFARKRIYAHTFKRYVIRYDELSR